MEPQRKELTLDESIKEVMQTLPPPIRNYLVQGKYTMVAKSLMLRYSLRIDQAGVLEREIMLLLMGIESPDEFAASLKSDASLTDDVVRSIMTDVNEKIFVPLREEMRKAGAAVGAEQPSTPAAARPEIPSVKPEAGVAKPTSFFHLENKLAPRPPATPAVPRPQEEKPAPPTRPVNPVPPASGARPGLRDALAAITGAPKQLESRKLLEDHEEPHLNLGASDKVQSVPPPPMRGPTPPPPKAVNPPPTPASPNLPGTVPPHIIPPGGRPDITFPKPGAPVVPPVPPRPQSAEAPPKTEPSAPPKAYTADPYREPIEP